METEIKLKIMETTTKMDKRRHFINFYVAGYVYWDGPLVFEQLKVGNRLELAREDDNRFDPYAVALYYNDCKIGFIPRVCNKEISKFVEMGYAEIFEVVINEIDNTANSDSKIGVTVYIKRA